MKKLILTLTLTLFTSAPAYAQTIDAVPSADILQPSSGSSPQSSRSGSTFQEQSQDTLQPAGNRDQVTEYFQIDTSGLPPASDEMPAASSRNWLAAAAVALIAGGLLYKFSSSTKDQTKS